MYLTQNQHGFVRKRLAMKSMLHYLNKVYSALDQDPKSEVNTFYADFSKAFDRVPHKLLLEKLNCIGVKNCFFFGNSKRLLAQLQTISSYRTHCVCRTSNN